MSAESLSETKLRRVASAMDSRSAPVLPPVVFTRSQFTFDDSSADEAEAVIKIPTTPPVGKQSEKGFMYSVNSTQSSCKPSVFFEASNTRKNRPIPFLFSSPSPARPSLGHATNIEPCIQFGSGSVLGFGKQEATPVKLEDTTTSLLPRLAPQPCDGTLVEFAYIPTPGTVPVANAIRAFSTSQDLRPPIAVPKPAPTSKAARPRFQASPAGQGPWSKERVLEILQARLDGCLGVPAKKSASGCNGLIAERTTASAEEGMEMIVYLLNDQQLESALESLDGYILNRLCQRYHRPTQAERIIERSKSLLRLAMTSVTAVDEVPELKQEEIARPQSQVSPIIKEPWTKKRVLTVLRAKLDGCLGVSAKRSAGECKAPIDKAVMARGDKSLRIIVCLLNVQALDPALEMLDEYIRTRLCQRYHRPTQAKTIMERSKLLLQVATGSRNAVDEPRVVKQEEGAILATDSVKDRPSASPIKAPIHSTVRSITAPRLSVDRSFGDFSPNSHALREFSLFCTVTPKLSISEQLRQEILKPLGPRALSEGYIYVYKHLASDFMYCKIGYTCNSVEARLKSWRAQCKLGFQLVLPPGVSRDDYKHRLVPRAQKVESLVHIELRQHRLKQAVGDCYCGKMHNEWFKASNAYVLAVITKWSDWIAQSPYEIESIAVPSAIPTGRSKTVVTHCHLKPEFTDLTAICKPLE